MLNNKYSKVLTVILIIAIIAIVGLLIFIGLDWYKAYTTDVDSEEFFEQFSEYVNNVPTNETQNETNNENQNIIKPNINIEIETQNTEIQNSGEDKKITYKGRETVGTIEIPKINVKYPVLADASRDSIAIAIGTLYGPGINEIGNTVLVGHNFKNGTFFSNNKKLEIGDKIYLTDLSGKKITYEIYKKYTTNPNDLDYAVRDTKGKREISLSTCTDDTSGRIIIWAKEV